MKRLNQCSPLLCGNELVTGDIEFLTKDIIKAKCSCLHKATCLQLVDLLTNKKYSEADDLLSNIYNNENKNNVPKGY